MKSSLSKMVSPTALAIQQGSGQGASVPAASGRSDSSLSHPALAARTEGSSSGRPADITQAPRRKSILVLTGGMGGGHTSPASAVHEALSRQKEATNLEVDIHYAKVSVAPFPRNDCDDRRYRFSNNRHVSDLVVEPYRRNVTQTRAYSEVQEKINEIKPDLVYVNHRILAQAASRSAENPPIAIATADHGAIHAGWYPQRLRKGDSRDLVMVPGAEGKAHAVSNGVSEKKVVVLGYPVRSAFEAAAARPKEEVRRELGLPLDKKVLVISGGSGHWGGYFTDLMATLAGRQMPDLHIVAIAGASAELKAGLEAIQPRVDVRGLCSADEMAKLTRAADFAGIKAGGATIGECYAVNTVPVVYQKLSGVEDGNMRHIEKQGTGFIALDKTSFIDTIARLSEQPQDMRRALENQRKLFTNGSAEVIGQFLLNQVMKD